MQDNYTLKLSFTLSIQAKNLYMRAITMCFFATGFFISLAFLTDAQTRLSTKIGDAMYMAVLNKNLSVSDFRGARREIDHLDATQLHMNWESFEKFRFIDFNGDGYKDLMIDYMSNVPARSDLLLFVPSIKNFKLVENFPDYPASIRLAHTNLYYSYHRSGCADEDWISDLYKIINNHVTVIGKILGEECEGEKLLIYRVHDRKQTLYQRYNINIIDRYKNHKLGFIFQYWKSHYLNFR